MGNMLDYIIGFQVIVVYIGICYFISRQIRKWTKALNNLPKLALRSFIYALLFGLGAFGGGGDPGFAFPCPIIVVGIFDIIKMMPLKMVLNGCIIPLVFWWIVFFIIMLIRAKTKKKTE
ncbi:MAG: hypothetical protein WCR42_10655 [bacterium]